MQLEELQAIWETQTGRPVFAVHEFGLHMELYRTRDRVRRRHFWGSYFPFFVGSLIGFGVLAGFLLIAFFQDSAAEFAMNSWDVLACLVGMFALGIAASSMYASRWRNEKEQNIFAPSLRQEIERGIAQLDFETATIASGGAWRNMALTNLAAIVICWEGGRVNGDPLPWELLSIGIWLVVAAWLAMIPVIRKTKKQATAQKRSLEALLASLDENPAEL